MGTRCEIVPMTFNTTTSSGPNAAEPRKETAQKARKNRSRRRWWLWLLVIGLLGWSGSRLLERSRAKPATATDRGSALVTTHVPVVVTRVHKGEIPVFLTGLGSVTAFNTVTVKSRVDGQLIRVAFVEGQFVQQGDLLAEIDPRPFQVQLEQAEGQIARDQALLGNARNDLARYQMLMEQDSIPRQQYDTQIALVQQYEGAVKADQAQIDEARLQLTYCRIVAPISGRVGLRLVDAGNMVHAGDTSGLVVITQVQPISVLFTIPEDNLPPVLKKLRAGARLSVDAYDRSGNTRLASGSVLTIDNQIDPSTGTSRLKAVFDNKDSALFPNQFVNARLLVEVRKDTLILPAQAIQRGPQGAFVYVVKPDETVEVRPVKLGNGEGIQVSVTEGLSAGESVVIDGGDKLRAGSLVRLVSKPGQGA
jgi:membrane fusion protein, multidrug efflux system